MSAVEAGETDPIPVAQGWSLRSAAALLAPLVAIAGVGSASGGFFPTSFGWTALAFAWTTLVIVSFASTRWCALDVLWLSTATAVSLFTFLSAFWAGSSDDAIDEGLRSLVYLSGVGGALVLLHQRDIGRWLGGLVLGVGCVCFYSLATRLLPMHFGSFNSRDYRLFVPIGYWNALGIFAAATLLVALGVASFGRGNVLPIFCASAAVVLAPTLYFTYSRGAWAALAGGTLVMFGLSPRRTRLIGAFGLFGAIPALGVFLASGASALTRRGATLIAAEHAGEKLALELAILALAQAALAVLYVRAANRITVSARIRRMFWTLVLAGVLAALGAITTTYGSPITIVRHAYRSFVSAPTASSNLNSRLFSLSNDGRIALWRAAWSDFVAHPLLGSGAGSYGAWWLAHRPSSAFVEDAHNLYLETLAELGIVGLLVLVAFLSAPLIAAWRARRNLIVAPAAGAYVAVVLHAGVDWDWEMPAVTLLAVFVGAALVASARRGRPVAPTGRALRVVIAGGALVIAAIAFVGLIGNIALARSDAAILAGNYGKAVSEAATARTWAPWSADALVDLGQGQILEGYRRYGLAALREAAADDPGDWTIWLDIAAATTGAQRRTALARAMTLNPRSPEIAAILAMSGSATRAPPDTLTDQLR